MKITHSITVKNRKCPYTIEPKTVKGEKIFWVECPAAGINQSFYAEDLAQLLVDFPQWISEYKAQKKTEKKAALFIRVLPEEKKLIEQKAHENGYLNISSFIRDRVLA